MIDQKSLLIPIMLRACLSGQAAKKNISSNFTYDFRYLDDPDFPIDNGIFQEKDRKNEDKGIHLHWSLPEAFTGGIQKLNKEKNSYDIEYPLVPNRWIVARLWVDERCERVQIKTFVLESDALLPSRSREHYNYLSPCWPHPSTPNKPYRYLGRCFSGDIDPATLETVKRERLTAVSPINPYYSAYYPLCRNVFAFYDDLSAEKLENIELTYLVCGWYQDTFEDEPEPFCNITTVEQLEQQFKCTFSSSVWPERTVCHGLIGDICWKTADTRYPTGIPDDPEFGVIIQPKLAVGNTSSEALSALAGNGNDRRERMFHYFLQDLLPSLTGSKGLVGAEQDLHSLGFSTLHPLELVNIKRKEDSAGNIPPTKEMMEQLSFIRQSQREIFTDYGNFIQKQRSVYENWYLANRVDAKYRNSYLEKMQKSLEDAVTASKNLKERQEHIKKLIDRLQLGEDYLLTTESDSNFYMPTEPVLVVKQLANTESKVTGKILHCRTTGETVSEMVLSHIGDQTIRLKGGSFCKEFHVVAEIPCDVQQLVNEAVLLSSSFSVLLAKCALKEAGVSHPTESEIKYWSTLISKVQRDPACDPKVMLIGKVPEMLALEKYKPQWYPLFLEWEISYYPDRMILTDKPDLKNWQFNQGNFLYVGDQEILQEKNRYTVSGRMLISDNASNQVKTMSVKHLRNPNIVTDNPRSDSLLSQSISGFNDFLMMKDQQELSPIFAADEEKQKYIELLKMLQPEVLGSSPIFNGLFSPIRAGFFAFQQVRMIDQLGRFQDVFSPDLYVAESMRMKNTPNLPHEAMLQPRLLQPSRLNVKWICADKGREHVEAGFVSTASPICGFILPNRVDHSIMAYSADGQPLGSLNITPTGIGVSYKSPPGSPLSFDIPLDINAQMYEFLSELKKSGQKAVIHLIEYLNKMFYQINTGAHKNYEIELIGRPIALVRASVKIESYGDIEKYRYNEHDIPDKTSKVDVSKAVFPVDFGMCHDNKDGMIGFFVNGNYSNMYVYHDGPEGAYFHRGNQIGIAVDPNKAPDIISFFLDPWANLTVTSGILPTISMRLPDELISESLKNIQATYFTSQILTNKQTISIPIAHMDYKEYIWYTMQQNGDWNTVLLEPQDQQAFSNPYPQTAMEGYIQICHKEGD